LSAPLLRPLSRVESQRGNYFYSPDTRLVAMAVLIAATSLVVCILYLGVGRLVDRRTQAWRMSQ
jgi:hypothetical protein